VVLSNLHWQVEPPQMEQWCVDATGGTADSVLVGVHPANRRRNAHVIITFPTVAAARNAALPGTPTIGGAAVEVAPLTEREFDHLATVCDWVEYSTSVSCGLICSPCMWVCS
jgi:broad specificity polyphosphatase/5'/3'-nucleotidase SurE